MSSNQEEKNSHILKWNDEINEQLGKDPKGNSGIDLSKYPDGRIPNLNPEFVKQLQEKNSPIYQWIKNLEEQEQTYRKR